MLTRDDTGFLDGFYDGIDGLDEGGFFEGDVVGEGDDAAFGDPGHGFYVLGEAAAVRGETCRQSCGFVLLALGEEALFAIKTSTAGRVVKAHHTIARRPLRDAAADGDDCAG